MTTDAFTHEDVDARYERMFGPTWRRAVARALNMDHNLISRMKGPTLRTLGILIEWMERTEPSFWPPRYDELARMAREHEGA